MTIEERRQCRRNMQERHHATCPICGHLNCNGMHVVFDVCEDGSVLAEVQCGQDKEGYAGCIHGGVISSLLDGAMTHCLFSHGIRALTAELTVRMICPLPAHTPVTVRAWPERSRGTLHILRAELSQRGLLAARAEGKFMRKDEYPRSTPQTDQALAKAHPEHSVHCGTGP